MKTLQVTKRFKKDVKKLKTQRKQLEKLKNIIDALCVGNELETRYRDHKLVGNFKDARECHIESDWLLIYETSEHIVKLRRTGSHSELFKL